MKHNAGRHPQMYCNFRFTHWMCTGYRYDNSATLSKIGIDFPESVGKIEILCSCSCHFMSPEYDRDPSRYLQAFENTNRIFDNYLNRS